MHFCLLVKLDDCWEVWADEEWIWAGNQLTAAHQCAVVIRVQLVFTYLNLGHGLPVAKLKRR